MRWPEEDQFPSWFFRSTPHSIETGMAMFLLLIAAVYVVYGVSTLRLSIARRPNDMRCSFVCTYFFWLALSFFGESIVYALLGLSVLRGTERGLQFWVLLFFASVGTPALIAFVFWLRDR